MSVVSFNSVKIYLTLELTTCNSIKNQSLKRKNKYEWAVTIRRIQQGMICEWVGWESA